MYRATFFLTSVLVGGEWAASRPGHFTPGTHLVDPRTGLDDMEKRKSLTLSGLELRPLGRPVHTSGSTDYAIPVPL
jgi:hypothetical protein